MSDRIGYVWDGKKHSPRGLCKVCGKSIAVPADEDVGRPREFCGGACKNKFYASVTAELLQRSREQPPARMRAVYEHLVISDLLSRGYNVYRSLDPNAAQALGVASPIGFLVLEIQRDDAEPKPGTVIAIVSDHGRPQYRGLPDPPVRMLVTSPSDEERVLRWITSDSEGNVRPDGITRSELILKVQVKADYLDAVIAVLETRGLIEKRPYGNSGTRYYSKTPAPASTP